jgi:UDP-glucose 4-epimerase
VRLLVTGGAGYIGSVVAALLLREGHQVVVLDDLSTGHPDAVPEGAEFIRGTLREDACGVLETGIDAVLHFAAKSLVGESVAEPALYWDHNLGGTLALIDAMRVTGVHKIVFSSTAAVYGDPERVPIEETSPTRPTSPYGASKIAVDTALAEFARLHGLGGVSLRYFNVAGAYKDPGSGWLGERHAHETHLIPNVLSVAARLRAPTAHGAAAYGAAAYGAAAHSDAAQGDEALQIFGDDYPTPDGTCIRDYIHVTDLARAHRSALDACVPGAHRVYNLGNGAGISVREVIDMCRAVTGADIPARVAPRRPGDPAVLVASSARIRAELGWTAGLDLRAMISDAWAFASAEPR